jgi:hypothetical protein
MAKDNCAECARYDDAIRLATSESIRLEEAAKFNPEDAQAQMRANESRLKLDKMRQALMAHCAETGH